MQLIAHFFSVKIVLVFDSLLCVNDSYWIHFGIEDCRLDLMRIANLNQGNTNWFYEVYPICRFSIPHEHESNNSSEMILPALLLSRHESVKSRIQFDTMVQYC